MLCTNQLSSPVAITGDRYQNSGPGERLNNLVAIIGRGEKAINCIKIGVILFCHEAFMNKALYTTVPSLQRFWLK